MRIAVEGCCHGELDNIYATVKEAESADGKKVDLLLICGDFQAIRNYSDLQSLAVPDKYRRLGGFYKYYSGEAVAPLLTIVIGGNHEASNYMWELFHGGWLALNIYYLGAAGSVLVNGLRISGASGIYKSGDYKRGRYERHPYDRSTIRSIYHTREYDIARLAQLAVVSANPTIFLSHDWPLEIEQYGDTAGLIRKKPFFKDEIASNTLGSPPLRGLLEVLKPRFWFAAHLHVKFAALYKHDGSRTTVQARSNHLTNPTDNAGISAAAANPDELAIEDDDDDDGNKSNDQSGQVQSLVQPEQAQPGLTDQITGSSSIDESVTTLEAETTFVRPESASANPDEIAMEDDEEEETEDTQGKAIPSAAQPIVSVNGEASETKFLALSKCLPGQDFLQIFDVDVQVDGGEPEMTFDPTWLAITRAFCPLLSLKYQQTPLPADTTICKAMIEKELGWIRANLPNSGQVRVADVQQFVPTAPVPGQPGGDERGPGPWFTNPQTESLCDFLQINNAINPVPLELKAQMQAAKIANANAAL